MERHKEYTYFEKMLRRPANIIFLSFMLVILTGTILLILPAASVNKNIGFIEALFTATSATCVTGLVVFDTATTWTFFGQVIILVLIQIGGLGLITLATFFTTILGKKVGLKGRIVAQEQINLLSFSGILMLIKKIILVTFILEFIGAVIFSIRFIPEYGAKGIYMGVFHSISAFNNAGFDIMGNFTSLTKYSNDAVVLLTAAFLIITGGLGFMVWQDLYNNRKVKNLLLHTKIVLTMTPVLILIGFLFFLIFESRNQMTLGPLETAERILNSLFMSVTARTAGFNSISVGDLTETTKIFTSVLMFIGAAPGSTAGGVKITTTAIILAVMYNQIRGRQETLIYGKKITQPVIMRTLTIVGLAFIWVIIITTIILGIEGGLFINVLFEVVSAFGTVGLSTGLTASLSTVSRLLIILTMFLGRIGPLTFAISLTLKSAENDLHMIRPEGKVVVG